MLKLDNEQRINQNSSLAILPFLHYGLCSDAETMCIKGLDWEAMLNVASEQGVDGILSDALSRVYDEMPEEDADIDLEDRSLVQIRRELLCNGIVAESENEAKVAVAQKLTRLYSAHGIKTVVLKGLAYAQYYPESAHRNSTDIDIYLGEDYELGNQLVEAEGIEVDRSETKHSHFSIDGVHIENHQFCCGIKGNKKVKKIESCLLGLLEEGTEPIPGTGLNSPSWIFNAVFYTYHARTHFLVEEGILLKHVLDWCMIRQAPDRDMERYWRLCRELGLEKFARSLDEVADLTMGERSAEELSKPAALMLEDIFGVQPHKSAEGSRFRAHLNILRCIWANRWKYRLYSDISAFRQIWIYVTGYLFDREPSID